MDTFQTPIAESFKFMTVSEMFSAPQQQIPFVVDKLLSVGGLSMLAAFPGCGKSVLLRQLIVAVSQGTSFLGREVITPGPVLYFALEDQQAAVCEHFRLLGLRSDDPVHIRFAAIDKKQTSMHRLRESLDKMPDVRLVCIDPIFRFADVRSVEDYQALNTTLEKLLTIAHDTGVHIVTTHHAKKDRCSEAITEVLGSTAIVGALDDVLVMHTNGSGQRDIVSAKNRYHSPLAPNGAAVNLTWESFDDTNTGRMDIGESKAVIAQQDAVGVRTRIRDAILDVVTARPNVSKQAIKSAVSGKTSTVTEELNSMIATGLLVQTDGGNTNRNPALYSPAEIQYEAA